jgi:hypothetical protein
MNRTPIFTVTTIRNALLAGGHRSVGFYYDFKDAEYALVNNEMDINECGYYPFAVIEEVEPGFYTYPRKELWYKWNRDTENYEPCPKPERFAKTVGWSLG